MEGWEEKAVQLWEPSAAASPPRRPAPQPTAAAHVSPVVLCFGGRADPPPPQR